MLQKKNTMAILVTVSAPGPVAEDHEESVSAPAPAAHSTVKDRMKSYRDSQGSNSTDVPSEEIQSETGTVEQDSESVIDTKSDGHPLQMCVRLTALQSRELKKVNEYRAEAGVNPVEAAPELMAFACYRALCDYTGDYTAHEWFYAHTDYIDSILDNCNACRIAENTVCGKGPTGSAVLDYAGRYCKSPEHYESMVNEKYHWFGCSNLYWGPDEYGKNNCKDCQYDIYLDNMSSYKIGTQ